MDRKIILTEGNVPEFIGTWTVSEVLAAAEFLRNWIGSQQIKIEKQAATDKGETANK